MTLFAAPRATAEEEGAAADSSPAEPPSRFVEQPPAEAGTFQPAAGSGPETGKFASGNESRFRYTRQGLNLRSRDGDFQARVNVRSQLRFSSPFQSAPRRPADFSRADEEDLRFRRARFKMKGHVFKPWVAFKYEHDLVDPRVLDLRVTIKRWEWLQFRFGQWKADYSRERVDSSGKQQFADRSIVNRAFTIDRQKGAMLLGRLMKGTPADSWYYAGVFAGDGRGFFSAGNGITDNGDGAPLWMARYQWNFLGRDPGHSQSDIEYHERPAAALAVATAGNRSRFTRFSSSGGGQLDGFEPGLPGQYSLRQYAQDFFLKYRGVSVQQELHWKRVTDNVNGGGTFLRGGYVQAGYFFHHLAAWVPKPLETAVRYAWVDPDTGRRSDLREELTFAVNWFFYGHGNKLTFDVSRFSRRRFSHADHSDTQVRFQWDVSF